MPGQSWESIREHGPHAVGRAERAVRPAAIEPPDAWDETPPPSSDGPTALRGRALKRALAEIEDEKKVESTGIRERAPEPTEPVAPEEPQNGPATKRSQ